MKLKIKIPLLILLLISFMNVINSNEAKFEYRRDGYYPNVYNTTPQIVRHSESNLYSTPVITSRSSEYQDHRPFESNVRIIPSCPCAAEIRCQPCSGLYLNVNTPECGCAPKLNCPVCPPLSLIHKIAAKKVYKYLILGRTRCSNCHKCF